MLVEIIDENRQLFVACTSDLPCHLGFRLRLAEATRHGQPHRFQSSRCARAVGPKASPTALE